MYRFPRDQDHARWLESELYRFPQHQEHARWLESKMYRVPRDQTTLVTVDWKRIVSLSCFHITSTTLVGWKAKCTAYHARWLESELYRFHVTRTTLIDWKAKCNAFRMTITTLVGKANCIALHFTRTTLIGWKAKCTVYHAHWLESELYRFPRP